MNRSTPITNRKIAVSAGLQNISPKTMAAAVLMSAMVILWGRVLLRGKGGPESASAQEMLAVPQNTVPSTPEASVRIETVALPCLPGRHDTLAADLFSTDRWTAYAFRKDAAVRTTPETADERPEEKRALADLDALSKELKLEAVIQNAEGSGMQAYIEDKVLTVGQVLTVRHSSKAYELTVTEITPQQVMLRWNTYSISLKITESHEL